jgi:hypothetical protein
VNPAQERAALAIAAEDSAALARALCAVVRPDMNAKQAARACVDVLRAVAAAAGQLPSLEVSIKPPGEPRHYNDTRCWCVAWEAGPPDWAVVASMALVSATGKLVEPYYGFDLMLYPSEWNG